MEPRTGLLATSSTGWSFPSRPLPFVVALVGAYQTYLTYRSASQRDLQIRENDLRQRLFEQKLKIFDQAVSEAGNLVIAPPSEFDTQLDRFGVIKHGAARMVGDSDVYNAMVRVYNAGVEIYNDDKEGDQDAREPIEAAFEALSDTCRLKIQAELRSAGNGPP